jgi:hypothetical protein
LSAANAVVIAGAALYFIGPRETLEDLRLRRPKVSRAGSLQLASPSRSVTVDREPSARAA